MGYGNRTKDTAFSGDTGMRKDSRIPFYCGDRQPNCDYHHGQLPPVKGAGCYQVTRANRTHPEWDDGVGGTYKHGADLAYWNGRGEEKAYRFMTAADRLSRFVLRTGAPRTAPNREEAPVEDEEYKLPLADEKTEAAVYDLTYFRAKC